MLCDLEPLLVQMLSEEDEMQAGSDAAAGCKGLEPIDRRRVIVALSRMTKTVWELSVNSQRLALANQALRLENARLHEENRPDRRRSPALPASLRPSHSQHVFSWQSPETEIRPQAESIAAQSLPGSGVGALLEQLRQAQDAGTQASAILGSPPQKGTPFDSGRSVVSDARPGGPAGVPPAIKERERGADLLGAWYSHRGPVCHRGPAYSRELKELREIKSEGLLEECSAEHRTHDSLGSTAIR